ncbi:MAG: TetR family transcriptional regulator [Candidatus Latescibacteria bacterium]|nr:TetR family transcriptional regulator [bacterium]MBD3424024.1 TetR family transcriptional regulator [Candidatus Latescibacterota bacterium]
MVPEIELTTEEKIIEAAEEVFTSKGKSGARMRDIADKAGINQALLHYYFRSKDRLFFEVFKRIVPRLFPGVFAVLDEDIPFFEKIERFIRGYIEVVEAHPKFPIFIIQALGNSPERLADTILSTFRGLGIDPVEAIRRDLRREIEAGRIIDIDPAHLMVNIISMSAFPFIARPLIERIAFPGRSELYDRFLKQRKEHVPKFIIDSIRKG